MGGPDGGFPLYLLSYAGFGIHIHEECCVEDDSPERLSVVSVTKQKQLWKTKTLRITKESNPRLRSRDRRRAGRSADTREAIVKGTCRVLRCFYEKRGAPESMNGPRRIHHLAFALRTQRTGVWLLQAFQLRETRAEAFTWEEAQTEIGETDRTRRQAQAVNPRKRDCEEPCKSHVNFEFTREPSDSGNTRFGSGRSLCGSPRLTELELRSNEAPRSRTCGACLEVSRSRLRDWSAFGTEKCKCRVEKKKQMKNEFANVAANETPWSRTCGTYYQDLSPRSELVWDPISHKRVQHKVQRAEHKRKRRFA
ncbi:hypothetical protein FB45DRAFT_873521 [Roridomyces roridus]|uniref:Uncharacterized protein n=1 Tax=Roridomyces roridus TaxID=1738132 RepID=A0AAD7BAQ4_9AGAR|nr:hypothetical protein FB45DRAFT_873521 [Roridomyces roridus]